MALHKAPQLEIQNSQIEPYVFPESGESLGNPNIPSQFNQFTANSIERRTQRDS